MSQTSFNPSLDSGLRQQLVASMKGGQAFTPFEKIVADMPPELQGVVPAGLPYSPGRSLNT